MATYRDDRRNARRIRWLSNPGHVSGKEASMMNLAIGLGSLTVFGLLIGAISILFLRREQKESEKRGIQETFVFPQSRSDRELAMSGRDR